MQRDRRTWSSLGWKRDLALEAAEAMLSSWRLGTAALICIFGIYNPAKASKACAEQCGTLAAVFKAKILP
jgi:hypothetical protein